MLRYLFCAILATVNVVPLTALAQDFEAHYVYLGEYPTVQPYLGNRVSGVAHDDANWYFVSFGSILKVPVGLDLSTVSTGSPGLVRKFLPQSNFQLGGDPDVFRFDGVDYLVVPISGSGLCGNSTPAQIGVFRCSDLSLVGYAELPGQCGEAGWVAVNESGELFSSRDHIGQSDPTQIGLRVYTIDWNAVATLGQVSITFDRTVPMFNESGGPLELVHATGGEFAPGDTLLYLTSGWRDDSNDLADREGIHVIDTTNYTRVRHSSRGTGGLFKFYYNPGPETYETPAGLTLWDLDDGRAPGIRGQMHGLVRINVEDGMHFKHYTRALRVDPAGPSCQTGSPACPFHTISAALNAAWDGAELRLRGGVYANPISIANKIRISAENGNARIGG